MVEVILYSRVDCHLCDQVVKDLDELRKEIPHKLSIIDVDGNPELRKQYGFAVPVVKIGPYTLKAPIERLDLLVTLRATQTNELQSAAIEAAIVNGTMSYPVKWTKSDKFIFWLSKHYLAAFNIFIATYVLLPIFAPVFMKVGATTPAKWIYRAYGIVCHELAFRSWFLFGDQATYPRGTSGIDGVISYGEATGLDENNLWAARSYIGNPIVGYKVALCERDIAIYSGILLFGIWFSITKRRTKSIHWIIWVFFGLVPLGLDGLSQLISQPPISILPYRESTPLLRSISGFLFGFVTAWFGYPYIEESMRENKKILEEKSKLSKKAILKR